MICVESKQSSICHISSSTSRYRRTYSKSVTSLDKCASLADTRKEMTGIYRLANRGTSRFEFLTTLRNAVEHIAFRKI